MQLYKDFIPTNSISYVEDLLKLYQIEIKVKSERRTRHGDFRVLSNGNCLITVNSNLNKYRFLITLIHEITHLYVFKLFKNKVKPHGLEWKNQFRILPEGINENDITHDSAFDADRITVEKVLEKIKKFI